MAGTDPEADEEGGMSTEEPGMMLMENPGPEGWDEMEIATDEVGLTIEELGAMGRAELAMDDEDTPSDGNTAPEVEQMVVVVATTVVDVRTTVALAGQSLAFEHSVV
jgi:hypothetical protein